MASESIYSNPTEDQREEANNEGSIDDDNSTTMKIDSRLRKSTSEPPAECKVLIDRLKKCNRIQLLEELSKISTWTFGKCELGHWKEVLTIFDNVLDEAAENEPGNGWSLKCDKFDGSVIKDQDKMNNRKLLLWILHFTTLLIEHSFSRHTYKSMDKLLALLAASDMSVVLGVLNLLYMFSKRSNFITRMQCDLRSSLVSRLHNLAESWGGKENGFGLADCCNSHKTMPSSATTLHFEFHNDNSSDRDKDCSKDGKDIKTDKSKQSMTYIHVEHVDQLRKTPGEIMKGLLAIYNVPPEKEMLLFTHVRLAYHFSHYRNRLFCVQARLQALSVLVYANALQDSAHTLLYNGLLEELVELIELKLPFLVEIRSAALRTLTSIIHLDRNPHFPKKPGSRLNNIIDVTGASQYHGFLPVLVRNCIASLTNPNEQSLPKCKKLSDLKSVEGDYSECSDPSILLDMVSDIAMSTTVENSKLRFPLPLATALFSFLYHLASYESGGDALVSCGMMESLLQVINWHGIELEHITVGPNQAGHQKQRILTIVCLQFVTRAVRVIDLITNVDMQAFYTHGGLQSFIERLDVEVNLCRHEHTYEFKATCTEDVDKASTSDSCTSDEETPTSFTQINPDNVGKTCLPQRTALLKSMLNFLKKALQDSTFSEHIRHLMEGSLPNSLKHIISNAEYYGPSLFLLATDVVTVYVFQEPSLLSTIQDNGLTDVVLQALLVKDVPATREVLASLPNVFSALCLNARGLASFVKCKPFERLFKVLLSPAYLSAMRKRRSSDPLGDAASNLGNAMDELMRHQPSLKVNATSAIIKLLNELCQLGTDPKYVCWRPHSKSEVSPIVSPRSANNADGNSSDEEDDDEEEASTSSQNAQADTQEQTNSSEKQPIALTEYILNVTKFIDAILSNNSTDDHCREFVNQGGLAPLLRILGLPNLPVDCPVTNSAQAVASVCKSILNLAHEPKVLEHGLAQLNQVLQKLEPLYSHMDVPGGSKLLHELANAPHLESAFNTAAATPLLHAMGAAHGYVLMFVHVCRTGQNEIRTLSLQHWGSEDGLTVLKGLAELYTSLVWESTLLLALCSDDVIPSDCDFGKEDMEKLNVPLTTEPKSEQVCQRMTRSRTRALKEKLYSSRSCSSSHSELAPKSKRTKLCEDFWETGGDTGNVASAMEALTTNPSTSSMDVDSEAAISNKPTSQQLKYIKPLLGASSRLGRALAELFGLLVKLCVGSPIRQRRGQNVVSPPTLPSARSVATALNLLLANGLNYQKLPPSPVPKFRLTFLICSVGFTSPMLFDEKRYPYHLMLQNFYNLGGLATFFRAFEWALSADGTIDIHTAIENKRLPEGTGEFLDAWLTLLEKMVNPKAILDSPHVISSRGGANAGRSSFDPLKYLMQIHSDAFTAVMLLWGKKPLANYGVRMSESILTILRHILRGEKIIRDRLNKSDEPTKTEATAPAAPTVQPVPVAAEPPAAPRFENDVSSDSLNALLEMGFSRDPAVEALIRTINLEQATEYLLSNPAARSTPSNEFEMTEDDQVSQAIAMSLGEAGSSTPKKKEVPDEPQPISEKLIDGFTHGALDIALDLIEVVPESVFKVCDLLVMVIKRNEKRIGPQFRDFLLDKLLLEIYDLSTKILQDASAIKMDIKGESKLSQRLGLYTHLYTLFFEVPAYFDMRGPCGLAIYRCELVPHFIKLLYLAEEALTANKKAVVPKWLTPILLLMDSLGKVSVSTQRKRNMHLVTKRIWKWFDVVSGKWTKYSDANNKLINDAYWNGEQTVRITCGRRRYTISFTSMQQINEESNNNRPISMTPVNLYKLTELKGNENYDEMEIEQVALSEKENARCLFMPGFSKEQAEDIVRSCVTLMQSDIDKDTLHALMRVCLRLTQDFKVSKIFVKEGGIACLLQVKEKFAFNGFRTLATLLIRHTLESHDILAYAIEKVIRGRTLNSLPPSYKEMMFLLRSIGSAITRNSDIFFEVAKRTLRIDNVYRRNPLDEDVDARLPLGTEPTTRTIAPVMTDVESMKVIFTLLNALVRPIEATLIVDQEFENSNRTQTTNPSSSATMYQRASDLLSNTSSANDILNLDSQDDPRSKLTRTTSEIIIENKLECDFNQRPILAKQNILKILADAVVSYAGVAKLITDYAYDHNLLDELQEDCTCLAFLFDKILPMDEMVSDRDCSMMCRSLIAGIASCNHAPDAQASLVTEVKAALIRALLMPESTEKHVRIQHITGIIVGMIEQCPPVQQVRFYKSQTFNANVNNIARLMLRKGIFNDLARVPHCLDMSSPSFPVTINSALKPMECLSKIVNQPVTGNVAGNNPKKRRRTINIETVASGTTSTDATNAQGEETAEDTENTDHDISAVASSLDGNAMSSIPGNVLEEIMEQLLDSGPEVEGTMEIDDPIHENEPDATEELMSTDSGESEEDVEEDDNDDNDDNDPEDEAVNNDDDAEDDEEEEEEDDDDDEDDDDEDEEEEEEDEDDEDDDDDDDDDDDENDEEELDDDEDEQEFGETTYENAPNVDRDEDIVMIQYADHHETDETLPLVRWNDNGFAIPILDDSRTTTDQSAPAVHPLLVSRHNTETVANPVTRTQRTNRARRYQYLQLNTRNTNPPVILQRLLGPAGQNIHLPNFIPASSMVGVSNISRSDSARVLVMDNFGIFPSVEEQIDFVDQTGYFLGHNMMATINHIPVVLHWWKEESRFVDGDSTQDIITYISNKLIPNLIKLRNTEINERKKKLEQDSKSTKPTNKADEEPKDETSSDSSMNMAFPSATAAMVAAMAAASAPPSVAAATRQLPAATRAEINEALEGIGIERGIIGTRRRMPRTGTVPSWPMPMGFSSELDINPNMLSSLARHSSPPILEVLQMRRGEEPPGDADEEQDEDQMEDLQTESRRLAATFRNIYNQTVGQPAASVNTSTTSTSTSTSTTATESCQTESQERATTATETATQASTSSSESTTTSGQSVRNSDGEEIPEGVDPSFLEALPPEMRREVIEQHRMLRLQQRVSMGGTAAGDQSVAGGSSEVSPEFLAALPPSLQEEVLTQQRLEQQRQAAARANPDEPVDAASFFETLQPSLRTMILSDMEDSQMSALPPDLAAEAQTLRRDWEARNRQVQERFLEANLTTIIRHSARGRLGSRFNTTHLLPQWAQRPDFTTISASGHFKIRGRQLLDHEALSCMLILLFVDDPKLNTGRLHRVIRNLCYHVPTRDWVIKAILSIIERSVHTKLDDNLNKPKKIPKPGPLSSKLTTDAKNMGNGANWLNIRMEAALGCHANVFIVNRASGKRTEKNASNSTVSIHPQAAPVVCRNALDLFVSLSRSFPSYLLPLKFKDKSKASASNSKKHEPTDFWEMLLKLDAASTKKGKCLNKGHSNFNMCNDVENLTQTFEQSPFGQLIGMLSSNVICGSIQLTDKLLKLLSVISQGMPEIVKEDSSASKNLVQNYESASAPEGALNLAVNVLTYKSCSEEGLEEVTTLLLNLSNCSLEMSHTILSLLLNGAKRIGEIVREQIMEMLNELQATHVSQKPKVAEDTSAPSTSKGVLSNRFTNEHVVISASTKVKTACDLQLPSMAPLTSKSSSQVFFLRVLRVIVQIREAIVKKGSENDETPLTLSPLSDQLDDMEGLWQSLSLCLLELEHTPDHHAVLVLQPAVEAFFLVHSPQPDASFTALKTAAEASGSNEREEAFPAAVGTELPATDGTSGRVSVPPDQLKFLNFAEKHRTVLNQILRQTTAHLADGPFSVLVDHTRVLDFDIKRRYFRTELERLDQNLRREETAVHVRREHIFEDSFRELYRRTPEEWKNRFYIVFEDEEGQDAGGLLREWYVIISRDIFNPMYALFTVSPGDRVTYMINSASHYNPNHLCYYKFVGRVIAKAIYDNKLLECYFTRSFYKHILGISVKYTDMESEDYSFYRGLVYLMENNIDNLDCDLTFSTEINEFGVTETRDLIPNGRNVSVTEENKMEYVRRSCQMKMTGAIRQQLTAFLEGFYDIIPKRLISIFNEQELELLISGLPNVDIEDLKSNTEYHKYQSNSLQIQWFWRALRSLDQADRAKFLQFVTGTSKVPLQGFGALEGMNGVQKFQIHRDDRSTDRLPSAHTCFNQLDLPVYETYDKLRSYLLKAIHECSEGFGFA